MAAQFNQATSGFANVTANSHTMASSQSSSTVAPGLFTVDADIFSNAATYTQMTDVSMAMPSAQPSAQQLFNSMQEGVSPMNNELPSEAATAVEHLLAGSFTGPSVETVTNPSSVIELNSAGQWQIDGVDIPAHLAEELSNVAAQYMQTTQSGDLDKFDLNQLQDDTEILISDPNSPAEMMVEEGINNSLSIPFSNSVELGAQQPNATIFKQETGNN